MSTSKSIEQLKLENEKLKQEISSLKNARGFSDRFSLDEHKRYGRQMLVPELGILGQHKLANSKILVVGAGGLGCPALAYLAGAGIHTLGIVDDDQVDISNLHRQILHSTKTLGMNKTESAAEYCRSLNPFVNIVTHSTRIYPDNCFQIFEPYDVILDCTDSPSSRYLVNDTAVLLKKPVVSASALKTQGQLSIFNYLGGPCYRCFYPDPPPPDSVLSCGDGGIVGPVVGVMGVLQAVEAIKILVGTYRELNPFLLIYNAFSTGSPFRYFRMREKSWKCAVCGEEPTITKQLIQSNGIDYASFCGSIPSTAFCQIRRIDVLEFSEKKKKPHTLIDVRSPEQFNICSLPGSVNIPYEKLQDHEFSGDIQHPVFVICRKGNDSLLAVPIIKNKINNDDVYDIVGGLERWSKEIDEEFPVY